MDKLPISVIIVAKNAESTIEKCLDSVRRNNPAEVIVVDGNSSDKTVDITRRYTQRICSDEGRGPSYAHQLGAEQATWEYIAYVDSDIVLPPGTLSTLLAELKATDYVGIAAKMLAAKLSNYWERAIDWENQLHQARVRSGLFASVLKREIVMKLGFDTFIKPAGDDSDFLIRLKRDGYKFGMSSAFVYHQHRADLKSLVKWRFVYGRGSTRLIRKYSPWHIGFWPPLTRLYWFALCLIKGKPQFIPYFIVDGMAQTAGMVKEFFELVKEKW